MDSFNFGMYKALFLQNKVSGADLSHVLSDQDLVQIGMKPMVKARILFGKLEGIKRNGGWVEAL